MIFVLWYNIDFVICGSLKCMCTVVSYLFIFLEKEKNLILKVGRLLKKKVTVLLFIFEFFEVRWFSVKIKTFLQLWKSKFANDAWNFKWPPWGLRVNLAYSIFIWLGRKFLLMNFKLAFQPLLYIFLFSLLNLQFHSSHGSLQPDI